MLIPWKEIMMGGKLLISEENQNFCGICDFFGFHGIDLAKVKIGFTFTIFLNVMLGITQ